MVMMMADDWFSCLAAEEEMDELTDQDLMKMYSGLDESMEPLMPSSNGTSFIAIHQSSPSKKRSRMSGPEFAADEVNQNNLNLLTKESNHQMTTGNVLVELLNVAADSGDVVEGGGKQTLVSPVKGCVPGKENSPEPLEKAVQDHPKRKDAVAMDGKATKERKISLNLSNLDAPVENNSSDFEEKDISSQSQVQGKRRNIFAVDGKAQNEIRFSLNASKLERTVERRSPEAETKEASNLSQVKSKQRNLFACDEDASKDRSFSLRASKNDGAVESKSKGVSSLSQVQPKRRNVFAVDGKAGKESRFSLNSSKLDTTTVNVKSR